MSLRFGSGWLLIYFWICCCTFIQNIKLRVAYFAFSNLARFNFKCRPTMTAGRAFAPPSQYSRTAGPEFDKSSKKIFLFLFQLLNPLLQELTL
jgi:hypothetical protein